MFYPCHLDWWSTPTKVFDFTHFLLIECILVGCVPAARSRPYAGVCFPGGGVCSQGGSAPGGVCSHGGGLLPWGWGGVVSALGVSAPGGIWSRGMSTLGGWCLLRDGLLRGVCSGGVSGLGGSAPGGVVSQHALRQTATPPVNRMANRCKNITLATLRPVIMLCIREMHSIPWNVNCCMDEKYLTARTSSFSTAHFPQDFGLLEGNCEGYFAFCECARAFNTLIVSEDTKTSTAVI